MAYSLLEFDFIQVDAFIPCIYATYPAMLFLFLLFVFWGLSSRRCTNHTANFLRLRSVYLRGLLGTFSSRVVLHFKLWLECSELLHQIVDTAFYPFVWHLVIVTWKVNILFTMITDYSVPYWTTIGPAYCISQISIMEAEKACFMPPIPNIILIAKEDYSFYLCPSFIILYVKKLKRMNKSNTPSSFYFPCNNDFVR